MRYVLLDLETELSPGPLNLDRQVPGITIAATLAGDGDPQLWYEQDEDGRATGEVLSQRNAQALVQYLGDKDRAGHTIVTWNGAGFDFRVLAHASGRVAECIDLAWRQVDMMFWFHCLKGFSIKLARAAEAIGSAKAGGLSGADAPRLWSEGQYERVKEYVAQDVRATAAVYEGAIRNNGLQWISARGRLSKAPGRLLSVQDAYKLPLPDTSWMSRAPWSREKFVGWMR